MMMAVSEKCTVYRKETHTDQYLNFTSNHPRHQRLGVVRTLMNCCETITFEEEDKNLDEEYLTELSECAAIHPGPCKKRGG